MAKLTSLERAIEEYVFDGDLVYAAGFTHLIPFAAGHEIIRQRRKNLVLARATPDLIYDQMVAAGCACKVVFSYLGNPGVGSLRVIRKAIENREIDWEEYTHFSMIARLQAGAAGIPFMPMNPTGPTDLISQNPNFRQVTDPYSGLEVTVVPPLNPDVAIIHVQRSDNEGNAQIWGIIGEQKEAAFASERLIITAEEIVPTETIRRDPNRTLIPGLIVDAVCHVPYCAHPSYTQGYYDRDNDFYLQWDQISRTMDGVKLYLSEWVYGVKNRQEYWNRLGDKTHARLSVTNRLSGEVNYGEHR